MRNQVRITRKAPVADYRIVWIAIHIQNRREIAVETQHGETAGYHTGSALYEICVSQPTHDTH